MRHFVDPPPLHRVDTQKTKAYSICCIEYIVYIAVYTQFSEGLWSLCKRGVAPLSFSPSLGDQQHRLTTQTLEKYGDDRQADR